MYGKVNDKIDVYAFGVVLLELLSGRKPISNEYPKGQESLVMWVCFICSIFLVSLEFASSLWFRKIKERSRFLQAKPILSDGKFTQLLDSTLGNDYDHDQMERMVLAATLCIRRSPRARPQMSLVSYL